MEVDGMTVMTMLRCLRMSIGDIPDSLRVQITIQLQGYWLHVWGQGSNAIVAVLDGFKIGAIFFGAESL
jgi:hypothetical protein